MFDLISSDMLLKIFSFQKANDVLTSRRVCRRFEDVISSNGRDIKKNIVCEMSILAKTDLQRHSVIEIVLQQHRCFGLDWRSVFVCRDNSLKVTKINYRTTSRLGYTTTTSGIRESLEYFLNVVFSRRHITRLDILKGHKTLIEEVMGWIVKSSNKHGAKIADITRFNSNIDDNFKQLANKPGCQYVRIHSHHDKCLRVCELNCSSIILDFSLTLDIILRILQQWSDGLRDIYTFDCKCDEINLKFEPFYQILTVSRQSWLISNNNRGWECVLERKDTQKLLVEYSVGPYAACGNFRCKKYTGKL